MCIIIIKEVSLFRFLLTKHIISWSQKFTDTQDHNPNLHLQMYPGEGLCDACVNPRFVLFGTALSPACGSHQFPYGGILTSQWTTAVTLLPAWTNFQHKRVFVCLFCMCFRYCAFTVIFQC